MKTVTIVLSDERAAELEAADPEGRTVEEIYVEREATEELKASRKERRAKFNRLADAVQAEIIAIHHPEPIPTLAEAEATTE